MPQGMTAPGLNSMGQVDDGGFSKSATNVIAGLAEMYKMAHKQDPGGAIAQGVQQMMEAVADLEATYEGASVPQPAGNPEGAVPMPDDPGMAEAMPPDAAMAPDMAMPPDQGMEPDTQMYSQAAGGAPESMDAAGDQLQTMLEMQNAAKRRPTQ